MWAALALSSLIRWSRSWSSSAEESSTISRSPFLTLVPSSMTQLMVLAYPLLPARTRQTTSLFSADSSVPFSVTVTLRSSFLTLWRMTSGRAVGGRVMK